MSEGDPRRPVFLERAGYRRRRVRDAARFLPMLGVALFLLPLMWPKPESAIVAAGKAQPEPMSSGFIYVFSVWTLLILGAAALGVIARRWGQSDGPLGAGGLRGDVNDG